MLSAEKVIGSPEDSHPIPYQDQDHADTDTAVLKEEEEEVCVLMCVAACAGGHEWMLSFLFSLFYDCANPLLPTGRPPVDWSVSWDRCSAQCRSPSPM